MSVFSKQLASYLFALAVVNVICGACGCSTQTQEGDNSERKLFRVGLGLKIELTPTQTTFLVVGVENSLGQALANQTVTFAIHGNPQGSTLSADEIITNGDGHASVELRAGTRETAFEILATTQGADPIHFIVHINKADHAALNVALRYGGILFSDHELTHIDVRIFTETRCDALGPNTHETPIRNSSLTNGNRTITFSALPRDLHLTLHSAAFIAGNKLR